MSRDWCPRELYYADKEFNFRDMKVVMHIPSTGEEFPLRSELDDVLMEKYPNFGFLYCRASELWEALSEEKRESAFGEIEKELTEIIEKDEETGNKLSRWYFGELDESFYYREWNDELLFEYLTDRFSEEENEVQENE